MSLEAALVGVDPRLEQAAATLGAFTKYPCESTQAPAALAADASSAWKKYGVFQSERRIFHAVATELGLLPAPGPALRYCRHPLAFLVEAADDISYRILDLEDGLRLNLEIGRAHV